MPVHESESQLTDSDEERWARRPMLQLPVVSALKDLGVAQGLGVETKELQAERTRTACSRLELVGRLGSPRSALGRLVGSLGLHGRDVWSRVSRV